MAVEQRVGIRKIVRTKALVAMDGLPAMMGRTIDVSIGGISLTFDNKLLVGQMGQVSFEIFLEGKGQVISTQAKVSYCIFSGDHFRIGFQFVNPDTVTVATINKLMR